MIQLQLPDLAVPDRLSTMFFLPAGERRTLAEMEGPGCIRHIWVAATREKFANRQGIIRVYFDDEDVPYVEAPIGDFFGVMHGELSYPINTEYLSVQDQTGYNCYFPMPFVKSARIEVEAGERNQPIGYMQVDWHRYPGQVMDERRRFCARWRRESPTERYGEDFLMLDVDGPGQLLGFVYGVRLLDNIDRWSHGGSDNIYIDGDGDHPAYLRGIGGEDTFGTSYGGALHRPETHLYTGMPYYTHEDVGEARPAQRLVGYRFYDRDPIYFRSSLHMRFGSMSNDICCTTYWYQEKAVRPFFAIPDWGHIAESNVELPRGTYDLALPDSGEWWLCGPFFVNKEDRAMRASLPAETEFDPDATYDGLHEEGSPWLNDASRDAGLDVARWVRRRAIHGFIDFNHVFRQRERGVARSHDGAAIARCVISSTAPATVTLRIAWDDRLILRVNDGKPADMGSHASFRAETVEVTLRAGANTLVLKLSNTLGTNHGGWPFAFKATTADGTVLLPEAS